MTTTMSLRALMLNPDYLRSALIDAVVPDGEYVPADLEKAATQPDAVFTAARLDKAADRFLDAIDDDLREYIDDLQLVSNEASPETRRAAEQVRSQLSADIDGVEAELAAMQATVVDYVGQVEQFTADVDDSVRRSDADADSREALERIRRRRLGGR